MRSIFAIFITVFFRSIPLASGQEQALPPSVGVEVKPVGTGGQVRTTGSGDAGEIRNLSTNQTTQFDKGTSTRSRTMTTYLEVSVRNYRNTDQEVVVRTSFIGKPTSGPAHYTLISQSDNPLRLPQSSEVKTTVNSGNVASATTRSHSVSTTSNGAISSTSAAFSNTNDGTKIVGWVVQVLVDGKSIASRASNMTLEAAARDPIGLASIMSDVRPLTPAQPPGTTSPARR